jgi:hypothetical protein
LEQYEAIYNSLKQQFCSSTNFDIIMNGIAITGDELKAYQLKLQQIIEESSVGVVECQIHALSVQCTFISKCIQLLLHILCFAQTHNPHLHFGHENLKTVQYQMKGVPEAVQEFGNLIFGLFTNCIFQLQMPFVKQR